MRQSAQGAVTENVVLSSGEKLRLTQVMQKLRCDAKTEALISGNGGRVLLVIPTTQKDVKDLRVFECRTRDARSLNATMPVARDDDQAGETVVHEILGDEVDDEPLTKLGTIKGLECQAMSHSGELVAVGTQENRAHIFRVGDTGAQLAPEKVTYCILICSGAVATVLTLVRG